MSKAVTSAKPSEKKCDEKKSQRKSTDPLGTDCAPFGMSRKVGSLMRSGIGSKPVSVILVGDNTKAFVTPPASAALTLDPSGTSEWSDLAAIFDEVKIEKCVAHIAMSFIPPNGDQATPDVPLAVFAYDPTNDGATVISSIVQGMEYADKILLSPQCFVQSAIDVTPACVPVTKTGMYSFSFVVPKGTMTSGATQVTAGNQYQSVTGVLPVGCIQNFVEGYGVSTGTAGSVAIRFVVQYHCVFRSRK